MTPEALIVLECQSAQMLATAFVLMAGSPPETEGPKREKYFDMWADLAAVSVHDAYLYGPRLIRSGVCIADDSPEGANLIDDEAVKYVRMAMAGRLGRSARRRRPSSAPPGGSGGSAP